LLGRHEAVEPSSRAADVESAPFSLQRKGSLAAIHSLYKNKSGTAGKKENANFLFKGTGRDESRGTGNGHTYPERKLAGFGTGMGARTKAIGMQRHKSEAHEFQRSLTARLPSVASTPTLIK
jgi:hypothetical protein